jgi:hypothetical protein
MDDTQAGPAAEADTTIVDPPPREEPEHAWSTADTAAEPKPYRYGRLVSVGLVAVVGLIVAAIVVIVTNFNQPSTPPPAAPNSSPVQASPPAANVPTTAVAAPSALPPQPPPPVVAAVPTPTPVLTAKDRKFLADLDQNEALGDPGTNTAAVLADARYVCDQMTSGGTPSELDSRLRTVWPSLGAADVMWFEYTSTAIYCPQIGGPV